MFKVTNKVNIILGIALFLIAGILFLYTQNNNLENNKIISEVCFENKCFEVEIADTARKREIGLMNREYLNSNNGMLFVFDQAGVYNFWMKNVLIPLDMIWIDENNKIIFIKENAEPCKTEKCESFGSDEKALYILEVNGGVAEEMGLEIGDKVEFERYNFL